MATQYKWWIWKGGRVENIFLSEGKQPDSLQAAICVPLGGLRKKLRLFLDGRESTRWKVSPAGAEHIWLADDNGCHLRLTHDRVLYFLTREYWREGDILSQGQPVPFQPDCLAEMLDIIAGEIEDLKCDYGMLHKRAEYFEQLATPGTAR